MKNIPTMYAVVSRGLAQAMRGEKKVRSPKGTVYGTCASYARALQYQQDNKLGLATEIVEQ